MKRLDGVLIINGKFIYLLAVLNLATGFISILDCYSPLVIHQFAKVLTPSWSTISQTYCCTVFLLAKKWQTMRETNINYL